MGVKKTNIFQLITNGVMTGTAIVTSPTQNVLNTDNQGLQITWTGTPTGVISILGSIDNVNFYALSFNPALIQPAGAAGGYLVNLNQFPWPYLQVQYQNTSSTGVLNVFLCSKDLN